MNELAPVSRARALDRASLRVFLRELYRQALEHGAHPEFEHYVRSAGANRAAIDRHVRAFELYAPYLRADTVVLDWGCRQAVDACLIRHLLGDEVTLEGCDMHAEGMETFWSYARLNYTPLEDPARLPYQDATFDMVIGSGVLEHVAREHESMNEIYRVLRPDGLFVVTFLPNRYSVTEALMRLLGSDGAHIRLYRLREIRDAFLRRGFRVERCGYHQVFPTFSREVSRRGWTDHAGAALACLNRPLERVWPVKLVATNLYLIARRVTYF